jgi:predicted nucleic acid-binding protein
LNAYLDTSFLVSLYTLDANTVSAVSAIQSAMGPFPLTPFCELELTNAVELRVFRHEITTAQAKQVLASVSNDLLSCFLRSTPTPATVYDEALRLSRRHTAALGTRTLDILHVAAALALALPAIFTFDRRQAQLARIAGLITPVRVRS